MMVLILAAIMKRTLTLRCRKNCLQLPAIPPAAVRHHVRRPVLIGLVNWVGLWTLIARSVSVYQNRATDVGRTNDHICVVFDGVFGGEVGNHASFAGNVDFTNFLIPGLVMIERLG